MPQMMPINWIMSFFFFICIFIIFNMFNYYIFLYNKNNFIYKKNQNNNKLLWKW
uniref:ATP synthase complex subunit 8 n=1 Tax=Ancema ctesia TaxID=2847958 RepID=A0A9E9JT13_9NEOP|nr:ATP synthase F0 subunit 8 [Ancema ctesia]WAR69338.1 ATP synthase F0 subunit 8 [Ancema ctesia]